MAMTYGTKLARQPSPGNPYGLQRGQQAGEVAIREQQLYEMGRDASRGGNVYNMLAKEGDLRRYTTDASKYREGVTEGLKYNQPALDKFRQSEMEWAKYVTDVGVDPNTGLPKMSYDSYKKQQAEADAQRAEAAENRKLNAEMRKEQMSMLGRSRANMGGTGGNFKITGL